MAAGPRLRWTRSLIDTARQKPTIDHDNLTCHERRRVGRRCRSRVMPLASLVFSIATVALWPGVYFIRRAVCGDAVAARRASSAFFTHLADRAASKGLPPFHTQKSSGSSD